MARYPLLLTPVPRGPGSLPAGRVPGAAGSATVRRQAALWTRLPLVLALAVAAVTAAAAVSPDRKLLVTGAGSNAVHLYDRTTSAAAGILGGAAAPASPQGVAVTPDGDLVVSDTTPRHVVVEQLYRHFLNRAPEQGGGNYWTTRFLDDSLEMEDAWGYFMGSAEAFFQQGQSNAAWLDRMFNRLGITPTASERNALIARLDAELAQAMAYWSQQDPKPWWWDDPFQRTARAAHAGAPSRMTVALEHTHRADVSAYLASQGLDVRFDGTNQIIRYDGATGEYEGVFATPPGLDRPSDLAFGPDGSLYAASPDTDSILRFDGETGAFLGYVVQGQPTLWEPPSQQGIPDAPTYLAFGPGGLYVSSFNHDVVQRYNPATGQLLGQSQNIGWNKPEELAFGPDGLLYVCSYGRGEVSRYSPATGAYLGAARGGLAWPKALLFRPQGDLLVGTVNAVQVTRFNPSTGAFLGVATTGGDLLAPSYLLQTGDLIPPTVSHTLSTAPNAAGWHRADVQVQLSAVDDTAVASLTYQVGDGAPVTVAGAAASVTLSMEGIHRVRYSARDTSGVKSATGEVTVRLDKTAPQIAGSRSPAANAFGWNNADVTVSFTASDTASGIASLTEPVTLDGEGAGQSVTGTALDLAGNSASTTVADIRIDRTAPVVTYTGGGVYTVDQEVDFRCSASDSLSGVASDTCQGPITGPAYTFALGPHSYSATATDRAGNTGSGSGSFTVRVTPASLVNLVRRFVANEGIATSLVQKLENAAAAEARGDLGAKAGLLAAFINEVEAQRGKTLTPAQASVLIALAGAL